jgi:hypothetical protein
MNPMNEAGAITGEFRAFKRRIGISSPTSISVRFVATAPFQLQINVMKTSVAIQYKSIIPSLFHIASRVEDFAPAAASKSAPSLDQTPFTDLMSHPDKLEAALKNAKIENDAFDASRTFSQGFANRTTSNSDSSRAEKPVNRSLVELKTTEFHLEAPFAESVKLAADFTDWEKFPLDMIKSEDGVWHITVPLRPGHYSYRFIVDGEWCDDPSLILLRLHNNPFGRADAVMEVA